MKGRRGFTLVELVVVIVLVGILAGAMIMYFKPAIQMYLASGRRAGLTHQADTALRRIVTEVRAAVPNSLRLGGNCLELVPTIAGGRYRIAPDGAWDAVNPANPTAALDSAEPVTSFDVLSDFTGKSPGSWAAAKDDWVVIGNQNTADLYAATSAVNSTRAQILSVAAAPAGSARITLAAAKQFPVGYDGGRFVIVSNAQQAVNYVCTGVGRDSKGTGTGTLYRIAAYGFNANGVCRTAVSSSPVLATKVAACSFLYNPDQGATQESGYVQVQPTIADDGEEVTLSYGAHVDNLP
ncbi:MAG: prepilin-type N-terminal cleavage/methylation domain-containing protein [Gammaproteobacteria bacterium]